MGGWEIIFYRKSARFDVLVTYMNCTCNGSLFWVPTTLGPWAGAKRSNINKSKSQSISKIFLYQTLCFFSQMNDIKHIRRDFIHSPGACPRGGTSGTMGVGGSSFFFEIQPEKVCELLT